MARIRGRRATTLVINTNLFHQNILNDSSHLDRTIDNMVWQHSGPKQRLELITHMSDFSDIEHFISRFESNGFKEIVFRISSEPNEEPSYFVYSFSPENPYIAEASLFDCRELTYLELKHCVFRNFLTFRGMPNLSFISVSNIHDPCGKLGDLISNSPSLQGLMIHEYEGPNHLKIDAPELRRLSLSNIYSDITITDSLLIHELHLSLDKCCEGHLSNQEDRIKIDKLLHSLAKLEKLQLCASSLQWFFTSSNIRDKLPITYEHLKEFTLTVDFQVTQELMASVCLLRSAPNLKILKISVESGSTDGTVRIPKLIYSDIDFCKLEKVKVAMLRGQKEEMLLLKHILAHALMLRTLEFSIKQNEKVIKDQIIFKLLTKYQRASTIAEVKYKENLEILLSESDYESDHV